ncbi:mitochondrial RNA binding complex 1 subunit [Trypanosoma equiperdum]|uniref:Mitochondrial RNA binding complex 1 subunit n=3 Tax=Trypanozoon TaxID=39700 RepID=Q585T1_TRYB2|nr:hypothetical protein, conserved [Trypanosoma brucei brucei TREU927]8FNI_9 Chain 9, RNA-editing substrate-binding complex protein 9 (RESC9) [Trypanosoma brucei]8FNK_9 Chain 9, RNA-editing substrate-binding complex protein 9 (RESC9) [Trypanosoma brucei]SCU71419.1 mitochondrial RNA binding complex 1 subunit [Trypanosoma equiperdum]AAQ15644.1 hypothetical protein, conserved [Trypanosoma brucei brucei TREU927]AAX79529.1 hypothetical protein, conserved [Trypanosoma brucei]
MLLPTLERLLERCGRPIFSNVEDVRMVMASLLDISAYVDRASTKVIAKPLRRFCHKDPDTVASVMEAVPIDAAEPTHGRRAAMLLRCLPKHSCDEVIWERAVAATLAGLKSRKWDLHDYRVAMAHAGRGGRHAPALAAAAEEFVSSSARTASQSELPALLVILTSLPELKRSPCLQVAADRIVQLSEILSPAAIGQICASVNKVSFRHTAMAIALQEEAIRFAEESDLFSAVQLFSFICQQEKEAISPDAVKCLAERVIEGKDLDQETVSVLCRALRSIPRPHRPELLREIGEMMEFLGGEVKELLELPVAKGGLKGDVSAGDIQSFISKFLSLDGLLPADHDRPGTYMAAIVACVDYITERLEDIVSDENPPFSIIPHLLNINMEETRRCGQAIIREAAEQGIHFPTLQVFRFLLALGDHNMRDQRVYRHLRNEFAKTASDIPMIQLCAALKCFVRGLMQNVETQSLDEQVEHELEKEDMDAFLRFCVENLRRGFADGMEVKCVMAATESLYQLGYTSTEFYEQVARYLGSKCSSASASVNSSETATAVCLALGEDILDRHPDVHTFLLEVEKSGLKGEASLSPTEWMNKNDPANFITPLTEIQQEGWNIINRMVETRAADTEKLTALANEYVAILKSTRVDDLKYFFGVFEEKVFKQDRILKQCLDYLVESNAAVKLSATSIGAMLNSLAAIRFTYHRSVKQFMIAISTEQWSEMDASPLVKIVSAMAKLSLRLPQVLVHVGDRLLDVYTFLSPLDTALVINSLQSIGYGNDEVLMMLMRHAASSARRWDEVSLTLLFGASGVHRLLRNVEVAAPLLEQAAGKTSSPHLRQRIAASLRRSALPRALVQSSTSLLTGGAHEVVNNPPLQLV